MAYLGEKEEVAIVLLVHLDGSVHNRNFPLVDIVHNNIAGVHGGVGIVQEEDVASPKAWLHGAGEHDHNLRGRVQLAVCVHVH